jgi:hypothetical protein
VRGKCVFCGDETELHNEHIWPDWLSYAIEWGKDIHTLEVGPRDGPRRVDHVPPFELTVEAVCQEKCNGGWMSDLETRAKGRILPMIQGRNMIFDERDQALIAFWALKTSMMFACAETAGNYIPAQHYEELFRGRRIKRQGGRPWRPIRKAQILLSAYRGSEHGGFYPEAPLVMTPRTPDLRLPEGSIAYGITMNLGHLVFQVFAHNVEKLDFKLNPLNFAEASVTIWPTQRRVVRWPPRLWIDDAGLGELKSLFTRLPPTKLPPPP